MIETNLYKRRSFPGCIRAAYELFCNNAKTILRHTWIAAWIYALTGACLVFVDIPQYSSEILTRAEAMDILKGITLYAFVSLLSMAAYCVFNARAFTLLNDKAFASNLSRMSRLFLLFFLVFILIVASIMGASAATASNPQYSSYIFIGIACLSCLIIILLLPTLYSSMKYLMETDKGVWSVFGRSYRKGWKYWGFLFMAAFLCLLICGSLILVCNMPATILQIAQSADRDGMFLGDATGLPSYFLPLSYVTTALVQFLVAYVILWAEVVGVYAYASIESRERNKTSL